MKVIRLAIGAALVLSALFGAMNYGPSRVQASGTFHRPVCPPSASSKVRCLAHVLTDSQGHPLVQSAPPASAYGPVQFHTAYNLPCTVNGGQAQAICSRPRSFGGQTIAIVDDYSDPNIQSDLNVYDSTYGLPACTTRNGCLTIVNDSGKASPLPSPDQGWALEISLDVETAHEICQTCKILLLETQYSLPNAVNTAAAMGATEISNSYLWGDRSDATSLDAYYNHPGVAVVASSGDSGSSAPYTAYPAGSPDVVAVGGTTLTLGANNAYAGESVWSGAGSGCSAYETASSWQLSLPNWSQTGCGTSRGIVDVSADADPATGAAVYDSYGYGGWLQVGGTSLSAPLIAGVFALVGGVPRSVSAPSIPYAQSGTTTFHDVTTGSNGSCGTVMCNAGNGYDGPTGVGTPNGIKGF
jgi:subtilase family serine protease